MLFSSLKKSIIFSVIAVFCYGIFVSCENPFTGSLGSKVDVEPPTITVLTPASGELLRDVVTFTGEATAYRDLRRSNGEYSNAVQVMIYDQADETKVYLPWTSIGNNVTAHKTKEKTWVWTYNLDTKNFKDVGFLKMKFQVYDESADPNRKPVPTVQLVYIVKNKPSTVKLSSPDHASLENPLNEQVPQALITGTDEIRGSILDRRGLKPGYPMIKIWPDDLAGGEPADDHVNWGWATLFLDEELDDPTDGTGTYADREGRPVLNAASFVFKLWEFSIDENTRKIMYDVRTGVTKSLPPKKYRFRIKTSDTYFNTATRTPRLPNGDERETLGYYPGDDKSIAGEYPPKAVLAGDEEEAEWDTRGPSYLVNIKSSGENPVVMLDNSDLENATLDATPHIYLTPESMKKIAVRRADRADFRLQILAQHSSGIRNATLEYEYMEGLTRRTGFLLWDNTSFDSGKLTGYITDGYYGGTGEEAEKGHTGWWQPSRELDGVYFRYTDKFTDKINDIFSKSTEFTLIVTAHAKGEGIKTEQRYTLYLDNTCPEVSLIRPVRGAANDPTDTGTTVMKDGNSVGGMRFGEGEDQAYNVNGNIQVSVNRTGRGIQTTKWVVENTEPNIENENNMLGKLWKFRNEPNSTNYTFYNAIAEGYQSGMVKEPATSGLDPDRTWNFKFNTSAWNGQSLWLYVIAQDEMQNLGFVLQKLYVDEESDKPALTTGDNFISTTTTLNAGTPDEIKITSLSDLYYRYDGTGNQERKNRLEDGGIELTFVDDDGISPSAGNITITLTDLNVTPNVTRSLTNAQIQTFLNGARYLIDGNSARWNGVLEQELMAAVLYAGQDPLPTRLPDGFYKLNVTVSDNTAAKVAIDRTGTGLASRPGDDPASASASPQEFFFAVHNNWPVLTIEAPEANSLLNGSASTSLTISGKVTSGVKIQRLEITFTPDLTTTMSTDLTPIPDSNPLNKKRYVVNTLYRDSGFANAVPAFGDFARTDNQYVYYWRIRNVNLSSAGSSPSFVLNAFDGLGYQGNDTCRVEIDNEPPVITLDLFNFGRDEITRVNGKVPIEIGVFDQGGIKVNDNGTVQIKWWVVPSNITPATYFAQGFNTAAPSPNPGPNGASGQLRAGVAPGGDELTLGTGKYWTVFNTTNFTPGGTYHLYAMAQDGAGNYSGTIPTRLSPTQTDFAFTINQASDDPVLDPESLFPLNNANVNNREVAINIKGDITDDDGFDSNKTGTYVAIRFATPGVGVKPGPGVALTWSDNWETVPAKLEAGILKFEYVTEGKRNFTDLDPLSPTFESTLEGYKCYQLRIYDEAVAGTNSTYYYDKSPHGKNPDGVTTGANAITRATKYYPGSGNTDYYYFLLDNGAPEVYFAKYDPNNKHPNFSASRPAYSNLDALLANLAGVETLTGVTNLNGGIVINEATEVVRADFIYNNAVKGSMVNWLGTKSATNNYSLTVPIATLRTWLAEVPFTTVGALQGLYSFTIEAHDPVGNYVPVEWQFNLDTLGPNITFNNVTDNTGSAASASDPIVSSRAGAKTYIRGRFQDDYSDIGETYRYVFDNPAGTWTTNTFDGDGKGGKRDVGNRSAEWEIEVPDTLADGPHTLYIEARDMGNNPSDVKYRSTANNGGIKFILDAKAPVVSEPENMMVTGTENGATPKVIADYERIFSAAYASSGSAVRVFTLSGMVYDRYLSGLTVNYPPAPEVKLEIPANHNWTTNPTITSGNLRLRRATAADLTNGYTRISNDDTTTGINNYLYVWELDIRRGDVYTLFDGATNVSKLAQITVMAQDQAKHNSVKKDWSFNLDGEKPTVTFINAHKGTGAQETTYSHYNGSSDTAWITGNPPLPARMDILADDFTLEGQARDGTGIKEIRYILSRSNDGLGTTWRYYNGTGATPDSGWNLTTPPTAFATELTWPLLYTSGNNLERSVDWKLNNAKLAEAQLNSARYYPANLSDGLYKLDMWVYDHSKAETDAGNPNNVSIEFFIDRSEANLVWTKSQDYYRSGNMAFGITATDTNGIVRFAQANLRRYGEQTNLTTVTISSPVTRVSATESTIAVNITEVTAGTLADGRYTLVMTIKDRSGKDAIIGNTVDFYLDNKKPTIALSPGLTLVGGNRVPAVGTAINEALTGRVKIEGTFGKPTSSTPTSPVARVAFRLGTYNNTALVDIPTANVPTATTVIDDTWLTANGWYFNDGGSGNPTMYDNPSNPPATRKRVAEIYPGTTNANVLIPNTRNFTNAIGTPATRYMGTNETAGASITFDSVSITGGTVNKFRIYILAIDEAGNYTLEPVDYWVYPEGDRPKVDRISNPDDTSTVTDEQRLFSGNFRIAGSASDNEYVKSVYFRVFKTASLTPTTPVEIKGQDEPVKTIIGSTYSTNTGGWYKANGGGNSSVSWWAMINREGELDPGSEPYTSIRIEVLSEDSIWDDFSGASGAWSTGETGLYSNVKFVTARVVAGAPTYANELVTQGASGANTGTPNFTTWSSALTTNVSRRASYAITVQGVSAIGEIRWTRPHNAGTVNLLDAANNYNTGTGTGTYALHYTNMAGNTWSADNPGIAVKAIKITDYEYRVVVDINSLILGGSPYLYEVGKAGFYPLTIEAADKSNPAPLRSQTTAQIPIDNITPEALYTYSTRVAGSSATFGGLAGDTGNPSGLSRVVIWFSRNKGSGEVSVPWSEIDSDANPIPGHTFVNGTPPANMVGTIPTGVQFPQIPAENGTNNYSSIIIDRNDPMGNTAHHGHTVSMGFATSGAGALNMSWYAVLNSLEMMSGAQTIHYVVYDKAGNTRYYNQKIMIMNGIPKIEKITLGTDIRGDRNLTAGTGTVFTGNAGYKSGATNRALNRIAIASAADNAGKGLSEEIAIDTSRPNTYSVVYDQAFNVRNNLLGIKIDTNTHKAGKTRYYRFEYVSNAKLIMGSGLGANEIRGSNGIKAGRIYIINDIGSNQNLFPWGALGAQGEPVKGLAFLALEDGANMNLPELPGTQTYETPSVWELNSSYYSTGSRVLPTNLNLADLSYTSPDGDGGSSSSAEFVYAGTNAFNATGNFAVNAGGNINNVNASTISTGNNTNNAIVDFVPDPNATDGRPQGYLSTQMRNYSATSRHPLQAHSLFIIRVFDRGDGDMDELFGDFALLSIRVNNNDKTVPYSQLYDLNPKTEGQANSVTSWTDALSPGSMGDNRTKGGLYNTVGNTQSVTKSGHIEPRNETSLNSFQMGGAGRGLGSLSRPEANTAAYFTTDTVSGDVIIRGYAEDDQRIGRVTLLINEGATNRATINILDVGNRTGGALIGVPTNSATNPTTINVNGATVSRVSFTETIDLNRHRVEWAYLWSTESAQGANYVVGNYTVRAVVRNVGNTFNVKEELSPPITRAAAVTNGTLYDYFNPSFPASLGRATPSNPSGVTGVQTGQYLRYNDIPVNVRPYITGFLRQTSDSVHNTRSRQGRYMFYRGETAVVTGFNLLNGGNAGNTNATNISLAATNANGNTANVGTITNFGITTENNMRYRQFVVNTAATTGTGTVTLSVGNNYPAVNTGTERPASRFIQPWNVEYGTTEGSELWDDVTAVHIWQSGTEDDNSNEGGNGAFRKNAGAIIMHPAMSVDPTTGILYASHNEGGTGNNNNGSARASTNSNVNPVPAANTTATTAVSGFLMEFRDPIIHSDIYRSPGGGTTDTAATTWVTSSIIGRSANYHQWTYLGGVYIKGPGGVANIPFNATSGNNSGSNYNLYYGESTWFNSSSGSNTVVDPATTDQFLNPHIITSYSGAGTTRQEHIHVSYFDSKDGSIKYKYNLRGSPENLATTVRATSTTIDNDIAPSAARTWVNLDGGSDNDDLDGSYTYTLTQARAYADVSLASLNGANDYLRETLVNNNATVTAGQPIYRVGAAARNTQTNITEVYAPIAGVITGIQQPTATGNYVRLTNNYVAATGGTAFTITPANQGGRVVNPTARGTTNAGEHNAIAVTADGYPVIAYYDASNSRLKLAVSNKVNPRTANDWVIRDNVAVPSTGGSTLYLNNTGPFVSIAIDNGRTVTGATNVSRNRIHIAAMNTNGNLVYIRGQLDTSFTTATRAAVQTAGSVLTDVTVQVVDSLGTVGRWSKISIDQYGNPWIAYQDTGYSGAKDGVKLAYLDTARFTKGAAQTTFTGAAGQDMDMHGTTVTGWETMHVPTRYSVENPVFGMGEQGRIGLECFPTRNYAQAATGTGSARIWGAAVSYLSTDLYRIAYYVK